MCAAPEVIVRHQVVCRLEVVHTAGGGVGVRVRVSVRVRVRVRKGELSSDWLRANMDWTTARGTVRVRVRVRASLKELTSEAQLRGRVRVSRIEM